MNAQHTPAHFLPNVTVDRQNGAHAIRSPKFPASHAPLPPLADTSEPAELLPVVIRGYN